MNWIRPFWMNEEYAMGLSVFSIFFFRVFILIADEKTDSHWRIGETLNERKKKKINEHFITFVSFLLSISTVAFVRTCQRKSII